MKVNYCVLLLSCLLFSGCGDQTFFKDELRGDGTSGPYHLSHRGIVSNSEKVSIEVRDRIHGEVIIWSSSLSRSADYTVDYDAGTLLLKEPVPGRDDQFNPIYIIAEYYQSH